MHYCTLYTQALCTTVLLTVTLSLSFWPVYNLYCFVQQSSSLALFNYVKTRSIYVPAFFYFAYLCLALCRVYLLNCCTVGTWETSLHPNCVLVYGRVDNKKSLSVWMSVRRVQSWYFGLRVKRGMLRFKMSKWERVHHLSSLNVLREFHGNVPIKFWYLCMNLISVKAHPDVAQGAHAITLCSKCRDKAES